MSDPRTNNLPTATGKELGNIYNHACAEFGKALTYMLAVHGEIVRRSAEPNKGPDDPGLSRPDHSPESVGRDEVSGGISND